LLRAVLVASNRPFGSVGRVPEWDGTDGRTTHRVSDGAGCGLDELAHLLELGENGLAVDPELLRELVYAGLSCHCTPHSEVVRAARIDLTSALEA
jgi:hypothetical protein